MLRYVKHNVNTTEIVTVDAHIGCTMVKPAGLSVSSKYTSTCRPQNLGIEATTLCVVDNPLYPQPELENGLVTLMLA